MKADNLSILAATQDGTATLSGQILARLNNLASLSGCAFTFQGSCVWSTGNLSEEQCAVQGGAGNIVLVSGPVNIGSTVSITITGQDNVLLIASGVELRGTKIVIKGNGNIVSLGPRCSLRNDRISVKGNNSAAVIGEGSTWVGGGQLLCESDSNFVVVGNDCMFAHGVVLRTSDGHSIFDRSTKILLNESKSIVVHHHVWLANGVRVAKGTIIGTGCVIGQASLTRGQLEPHSLYVGSPAIKRRGDITWSRNSSYDNIPELFR